MRKVKILFSLALALGCLGGAQRADAQNPGPAPKAGKIYKIKAVIVKGDKSKNGTWSRTEQGQLYLYSDGNNNTYGSMKGVNASTVNFDNMDMDAKNNYYWRLNEATDEKGDKYIYFTNMAGNGYIGRCPGRNYTGVGQYDVTNNGFGCTGNFDEVFKFVSIDKCYTNRVWTEKDWFGKETTKTESHPSWQEGWALKFKYKKADGKEDGSFRYVSIDKDGEINWFMNAITYQKGASGAYNTCAFVFEEVNDIPTYELKLTRSDNDKVQLPEVEDYNYYATLYYPFAVKLPTDIKVWAMDGLTPKNNTQVTLHQIKLEPATDGSGQNVLPANTPVLLSVDREDVENDSEVTTTRTLTYYVSVDDSYSTGFSGVMGRTNMKETYNYNWAETPNIYILGKVDGRVAFYWLKNDWLGANKAYYRMDNAAYSRMSIVFADNETTGVTLPAVSAEDTDAPVYDLSGRRVTTPAKGIYIRGGKKFVVR